MDNSIQRFLTLSLLAAILLVPVAAAAASTHPDTPGRIIVGYKTPSRATLETPLAAATDTFPAPACNATVVDTVEPLNVVVYSVNDTESFVAGMATRNDVAFIEPDYPVYACSPEPFVPYDPDYHYQWGPAAIGADDAWSLVLGSEGVTIAIVDTGVDYTHPDIAENYIPGGYDWVNGDTDPMDDHGHGTHCAGIAAATIDNGIGIAGVAQVQILAEKVLNAKGSGTTSAVAQGIIHAADSGADIISLSLGGTDPTSAQREACEYAWEKGCVIVAASGNSGVSSILYPAAFDTVIAVGSLNTGSTKSSFSNYGSGQELMAPGENIHSTWPQNQYKNSSGTSMATPFVAGVAALVKSRNPDLTNAEIRSVLAATADDLGAAGRDSVYGYGRVDAFRAVEAVSASTVATAESTASPAKIPCDTDGNPGWGESATLTVTIADTVLIDSVTMNLSSLGGPQAAAMSRSNETAWTLSVSSSVPSPYADGAYRPVNLTATVTALYGAEGTKTTIPILVIKNGDVNEDNNVSLYDALYIARHTLGIEGYGTIDAAVADVTGDGTVNFADALYTAKHVLGLPGYEALR